MATFETSKILAGIGSLLFGVPLVGLILVLLGMKGLSEHYKDRRIYDGLINGIVLLIISTILCFVGLAFLTGGSFLSFMGPVGFIGGILGILVGFVCFIIAFVLALLAVKHVRNCLHALADRSGENLFKTAGTLLWIGAILMLIGVGAILMWIGFIIAAIGFFTVKGNTPQQAYNYTPPPPNMQSPSQPQASHSSKANFCPNCGASVAPEATFCANCGKQI